jgi:hypothetical protein
MRRKPTITTPTQHALLVIWGEYARSIGMIDQITEVPIHQKTREHTPQSKILEFFMATLAGLPYLQDISRSAHPLDQDVAVAEAWGQTKLADYSGVDRTLNMLDISETNQIIDVFQKISQTNLDKEIALALEKEGRVVYDGDLTGLPVSKSSETYPEVAYGHMDDSIQLGYQAALVSMRSPTYGRLWISVAHHSGNTISSKQARAMVESVETSTRRRPKRRTDLIEERLKLLEAEKLLRQERLEEYRQRLQEVQIELLKTQQQEESLQQELVNLEQEYQAKSRLERPTSELANLRQRVLVFQKRCLRRQRDLAHVKHLCESSIGKVGESEAEMDQISKHLQRCQQDNSSLSNPIQAVFRLDAGFGTWENVTWLIEMGYEIYTKVNNTSNIKVFHRILEKPDAWVPVGVRAYMQIHAGYKPEKFPYPLDLGLELFHIGREKPKPSVLLHFGPEHIDDPKKWFRYYNERQSIEAGIKENKCVFFLHHFKVRSLPAIVLQEACVVFAANFIRWANLWIEQNCSGSALSAIDEQKIGMKRLVQVMAHTSGEVSRSANFGLLRFSSLSCLADKELRFPYQPVRPRVRAKKITFFLKFLRFAQWLHNP